jgi:hypothetical protein
MANQPLIALEPERTTCSQVSDVIADSNLPDRWLLRLSQPDNQLVHVFDQHCVKSPATARQNTSRLPVRIVQPSPPPLQHFLFNTTSQG